jgi:hypothetical protein
MDGKLGHLLHDVLKREAQDGRTFTAEQSGKEMSLPSSPSDIAPDRGDPIVSEVHRIRQELLEEFGGGVDALVEDANRRLLNGEPGERPLVSFPPERPTQVPNRALG